MQPKPISDILHLSFLDLGFWELTQVSGKVYAFLLGNLD